MMIDPKSLGLKVSSGLSNGWISCVCPFHSDKTPSAAFNVETGSLYCFVENKSFSVDKICRKTGGQIIRTPYIAQSEGTSQNFDWAHLLFAPLAMGNWYAEQRGLDVAMIRRYGIRQTPNFLIFPIYDKSKKVTGVQIRFYGDGAPQSRRYLILGKRQPLWPFHELKDHESIILVEGIIGSINFKRHGFDGTFATIGAAIRDSTLATLMGRKTTSVFDNDIPGMKAMYALAVLAGSKVVFPGGEADEMSKADIKRILSRATYSTSKIEKYLRLSGNEKIISDVQNKYV